MGLLFAFFLIGLPLAAGVWDYMLTTGQYKNDDMTSKMGGYTPRAASASRPADSTAPMITPPPAHTSSNAPDQGAPAI